MTKNATNEHINKRLSAAGLRCTSPRIELSRLLFGEGEEVRPRHITAEQLYAEALAVGIAVSQATIYNTLNQFRDVGLLTEIVAGAAGRHYFDTNLAAHHHFYIEEDDKAGGLASKSIKLIDIPADELDSVLDRNQLPAPPKGFSIDNLSLMIELKKIG